MALNPSIFKSYDIRGVFPQDFGDRTAFRVGQALVRFTGAKRVILGADARTSTPSLKTELIEGLVSAGADVIDVGLTTTPMFYFAVYSDLEADAGIMVTASHNPAQYNGFKLVSAGARPIGKVSGMNEIQKIAEAGPCPSVTMSGKLSERKITDDYLDRIFSLANVGQLPLKVVMDAGNGMIGVIWERFAKRAGLLAEVLCGDVDCSFPNHEANPLKEETLAELKKQVVASGAALGLAFDGDADRVGLVDERGERVSGHLMGTLIGNELLKKNPGALIYGDVRAGRDFKNAVEAAGGHFDLMPVGHANIKTAMAQSGALFAAELSYHFYYQSLNNCESSLLTTLLLLKIVAESKKSVSELLAPFKKHATSDEINFEVKHQSMVIEKMKAVYAAQAEKVVEIDGLRFEFADWWFSVRASNTEPLLRLCLEAETSEKLHSMTTELSTLIKNNS